MNALVFSCKILSSCLLVNEGVSMSAEVMAEVGILSQAGNTAIAVKRYVLHMHQVGFSGLDNDSNQFIIKLYKDSSRLNCRG